MRRIVPLALPALVTVALLPLGHCKPFEIHCVTADNCEQGQACVAGLCQDGDGGPVGAGGDAGAGGAATGTGGGTTSGTTGTGGGSTTDGGSGSACSPACAAPKPHCVGGACVQCTTATQATDCPGEKCCPKNSCSLLMACL